MPGERKRTNLELLLHLNRLSDLLFVLGRVLSDGGRGDVQRKPGARQKLAGTGVFVGTV